jgi:hypothetical protein
VKPANPFKICRVALIENLRHGGQGVTLDKNGYVADLEQNLLEGVRFEDFEADLRQGDGNELGGKIRAAHSSSALAVNCFAPFRRYAEALWLPQGDGFELLGFEQKCSHGIAGRRSPNLDVMLNGPDGRVAIESKCLEYLNPHPASFAPIYDSGIQDARRDSGWFREMCRLCKEPSRYRYLDAAQLIKHAFGLLHTFPGGKNVLLYLFWEPLDPEGHPCFAEHRAEIEAFAQVVSGGALGFASLSYPQLWRAWSAGSGPDWLKQHVDRLILRYGVKLNG